MAYLTINVNPTTVTYEDWFIYTINASFSGLTGPLSPVNITAIIPDYIEFVQPLKLSPIQNITTEAVTGGTKIIFDFGTLTNTGTATTIQLSCRYKLTADITSAFALEASMYINTLDTPYFTAVAAPVSFSITPLYTLSLNTVLPSNNSSAAGGSVIYEALLTNIGDQWQSLTNFVFTFNLDATTYLTLDPTLTIVGEDITTSRYQDTSCDNIEAVISGNSFTFTLPSYKGQIYHFYFRATAQSGVSIGTSIPLTGTWSIDGTAQSDAINVLQIVAPSYTASSTTSGPLQVQANNYMEYTNFISNTGNQALTGVMVEFEIPVSQINSFRFNTGSYTISPIDVPIDATYEITYVTATTPPVEYPLITTENPDGYYSMAAATSIDLASVIPSDRIVQYVRFKLANLPMGAVSSITPSLEAYAADNLVLGTNVTFHTTLYWNLANSTQTSVSNTFATPVSLLSELYIESHTVSPATPVVPGDLLTFTSRINCTYSQLNNPIFMNLIPEQLSFVEDATSLINSIYFTYYNGLTGVTINSTDNHDVFPFPEIEIIPNFNATTNALLRLSYAGTYAYAFPQNSILTIAFKAKVNIGAVGLISNYSILGNYGPYGSISHAVDVYTEVGTEDIDGDNTLSEQLAASNTVQILINDFTSVEIIKESKGAMDTSYTSWPNYANSYAGGTVDYKLTITNNGNRPLTSIELVDIIPHVNDTGVILIDQNRQSEFPIYQVTNLELTLLNSTGQPVLPAPTITAYYSKSFDPLRFGVSGDLIGSIDDWNTSPPDPITDIGAYKVITSDQTILPGQSLIIHAVSIIPTGVTLGQIAWNSFAVKASYITTSGILSSLLPVEPESAGVIISTTPGTGTLSGLVWFDENSDGIYNPSEVGINDVGVMLYKLQGTTASLVATTITVPDVNGTDGHFTFSLLEPGSYVLRFAPDFYKYTFSPQHLETANGSMTNATTGFTLPIEVLADTITSSIKTGLINFRTSEYILALNKQAGQTLRSGIYSQMLVDMRLNDIMTVIKNM